MYAAGAVILKVYRPDSSHHLFSISGDSIYDLVIKTYLIDSKGNMPVNKLNRMSSGLVKAQTQSEMIGRIEHMLDEEEEGFTKEDAMQSRIHSGECSITDYRRGNRIEALMGYLYLSGIYSRMMELIKAALTDTEKWKKVVRRF